MRLVQGPTAADDDNSHTAGLALLGLCPQEAIADDGPFRLWPDNVQAVDVFGRMLSQLVIAEGVVVGLRYESLPIVCLALRVGPGRRRRIFPDLQVMEAAAIEALNTVRH